MTTFTFDASTSPNAGAWLVVKALFETVEQAQSVAVEFPKALRVKGTTLSTSEGLKGIIMVRMNFIPNKTTGEKNETAWNRFERLEKALVKLGHEIEWEFPYANSIDRDRFVEVAKP